MRNILYISFVFCLTLIACQQNMIFEQSPTERTKEELATFDEMLKSAPYGWEMIYFPKVDSLLFVNASEVLKSTGVESRHYGYGGYLYLLTFQDGYNVRVRTEVQSTGEISDEMGEYTVSLNSSIQLSFTTFTSIHQLINNEQEGVSDFLFQYKDFNGDLVFTTANEQDGKRSYVVFRQLKEEGAWVHCVEEAVSNRSLFENMKNPQIKLMIGGKTLFQSDVPIKSSMPKDEGVGRRYHLFLYELQKYGGVIHMGYNALGSGYVPTPEGLTFRPGFSHNSKVFFRDFKREGDKFVAELVSVYNPLLRNFQIESKHLYPDGEVTNYRAEIYDMMLNNYEW